MTDIIEKLLDEKFYPGMMVHTRREAAAALRSQQAEVEWLKEINANLEYLNASYLDDIQGLREALARANTPL